MPMVFTSDLDRQKYVLRETVADFEDMLSCTDEPHALIYETRKLGVRLKIEIEDEGLSSR